MNILITGGNGYIAKSLYNTLYTKYQITKTTRDDFDLTNLYQTSKWFENKEYDVLIHTAVCGGSRLKIDDSSVIKNNVQMHENLYANKHQFKKFISFGSGAEIYDSNNFYGASKRIIADSIKNTPNFYNLRIFGVFDENELKTRFIKANILRYINKQPIIIHTDKIMDFIYMKDLISLVDYYIQSEKPAKEVNCSYENKYMLSNIANIINELSDYKVPIQIENKSKLDFYCGLYDMPIKTLGLKTGIYNVYTSLLNGDLNNA